MPFVVDASVAASWLMPDESDPVADLALARLESDPGLAPAHWWFEIRNIFVTAERRGRLPGTQTERVLALLAKLPITIRHDADEDAILRLARTHGLTVYDAAYLDLAVRSATPLATLDRALVAAAKAEGVMLIGINS